MEGSDTTISSRFFDSLWPLILDHNECDIESANNNEYFIPKQKFDHVWAHEFLASKCYDNYAPPIELQCNRLDQKQVEIIIEEEIEQLPYRTQDSKILPLDQQLAIIQHDVEIRKKLAHDFANRKFPWYIQRPSHMLDFKITTEIKQLFNEHLEFQILKGIQYFQCHLMIIDVAPAVPLTNLERWLKFSPYVAIVTVIHDQELYRKVKNFNCIFKAVLMLENTAGTWQEELNRSIDVAVEKAKELFLLDDVSKPFVFVFSYNRGICVCDQFKILRKS